jgi:hypothetical protein|eukprot:COSAG06_NODE_2215_length_7325_cov_5.038887_8_plen_80_part_00
MQRFVSSFSDLLRPQLLPLLGHFVLAGTHEELYDVDRVSASVRQLSRKSTVDVRSAGPAAAASSVHSVCPTVARSSYPR